MNIYIEPAIEIRKKQTKDRTGKGKLYPGHLPDEPSEKKEEYSFLNQLL